MSEGDTSVLAPRSDLGVRTASGVAMMLIAGGALWAGGWIFKGFIVLVVLALLREWMRLVRGFVGSIFAKLLWNLSGLLYIGFAAWSLVAIRNIEQTLPLFIVGMVIAVDVGAYFAGRTLRGPKIAPKISPSKTWAGLLGATISVSFITFYLDHVDKNGLLPYQRPEYNDPNSSLFGIAPSWPEMILSAVIAGFFVAVVAQSGDFFESWMKRKAGVKDSGSLIPGHGGLLDRVDGLLAILCLGGIIMIISPP